MGFCLQDPRIERLPCTHAGTYADDCICERVRQHRCYIVATCDRDLRRRIRKVCPLVQSGALGQATVRSNGSGAFTSTGPSMPGCPACPDNWRVVKYFNKST